MKELQKRILSGVTALGMLGSAFGVWYFDPSNESFFPICPLFSLTGFACPGCGMTRAMHSLVHGDVYTAIDYNILSPIVFILLFVIFTSLSLKAIRGSGLAYRPPTLRVQSAIFIAVMVFGIVRNIPAYPFTFLFT